MYKVLSDKGDLRRPDCPEQNVHSLNFLFETWHLGTSNMYIFMSYHVMSLYVCVLYV